MLTFHTDLLNPNVDALEDSSDPLEALTSRRQRGPSKNAETLQAAADSASRVNAKTDLASAEPAVIDTPGSASPAELEGEAEAEGAFNPVTGEINWDCPCLGGMADGPCGEEFKAAFSCFIYSNEEPKGMECIDKFQGMQNCFREHPEHYKGELEDDEELDAGLEEERQNLTAEIAERQKAVKDRAPEHRLLEEPGSAPTPRKNTAKPSSTASKSATEASSSSKPTNPGSEDSKSAAPAKERATAATKKGAKPQPEAKTTSDPHPNTSNERELEHGAESQTLSSRSPPPNKDAGAGADLVPKEAGSKTLTGSPPPLVEHGGPDTDAIPKAAWDARDPAQQGGDKTPTEKEDKKWKAA